MTKHLIYLLGIVAFCGCSLVSKQYYYVPSAAHQTIKTHEGYFKMLRSQFQISDTSGKQLGLITTGNGIGTPLFAGPPYLPVLPVGLVTVFFKADEEFEIDMEIRAGDGQFYTLSIDSASYKKTNDSLQALHMMTARPLKTTECYMIVNGSTKVPLQVSEYFMGSTQGHSYRLRGDIRFGKVRTATFVTGNPLLDRTLKNITFKRNTRLSYCVMGFS